MRLLLCDEIQLQNCHSYGNFGKLQGNPLHPQRPLLIELHLIKAGRLFHRMIGWSALFCVSVQSLQKVLT